LCRPNRHRTNLSFTYVIKSPKARFGNQKSGLRVVRERDDDELNTFGDSFAIAKWETVVLLAVLLGGLKMDDIDGDESSLSAFESTECMLGWGEANHGRGFESLPDLVVTIGGCGSA